MILTLILQVVMMEPVTRDANCSGCWWTTNYQKGKLIKCDEGFYAFLPQYVTKFQSVTRSKLFSHLPRNICLKPQLRIFLCKGNEILVVIPIMHFHSSTKVITIAFFHLTKQCDK